MKKLQCLVRVLIRCYLKEYNPLNITIINGELVNRYEDAPSRRGRSKSGYE